MAKQSVQHYAVIPDLGGHLHVFHAMLDYLDINLRSLHIPEHLTIVQLGDLVHKGPDSTECVKLAYNLKRINPKRYIQLIGNHEAHYLGGPSVTGRRGVSPVDQSALELLTYMWENRMMQPAYALTANIGEVLLTHGGLTCGVWEEMGSPEYASAAAAKLNRKKTNTDWLYRPGKLQTGEVTPNAGILHPRTGAELSAGWIDNGSMPFHQMHGHETLYHWHSDDWHGDVPELVKAFAVVDLTNKHTWTKVNGKLIWSIDPAFDIAPPERIPAPAMLVAEPIVMPIQNPVEVKGNPL